MGEAMADIAQHALLFSSIFLLSIIIPIGIFIGRNNVRSTRGQLVDDLAQLFSFAKEQGGTPLIVPSFELIKYKYDADRDPIPTSSWVVPVVIYVLISFLGFVSAFLGGYLWTVQYLIRRGANFDLRPRSFVRSAIHILFGSFVTAAAWHA